MTTIIKALPVFVAIAVMGLPLSAIAEDRGFFVSVGATGAQTKTSYQDGTITPSDTNRDGFPPKVTAPIAVDFKGESHSTAAFSFDIGYDFDITETFFAGVLLSAEASNASGGNSPKTVGQAEILSGSTTGSNGGLRPLYGVLDNRYQVASEDKLGPVLTLGAKLGGRFDRISLAGIVGYSTAEAEVAYGAGFEQSFGARNGTLTFPITIPAASFDKQTITRSSETLSGVKLGVEAEYHFAESWSVVLSASTLDLGEIEVANPTSGSALVVGYEITEGSLRLRRRF